MSTVYDIIFAIFKLFVVPVLFFFFYFFFALTAIIEKIMAGIDRLIDKFM